LCVVEPDAAERALDVAQVRLVQHGGRPGYGAPVRELRPSRPARTRALRPLRALRAIPALRAGREL